MYTNELYHHGIKGQRWGIRRYQHLDGTLTPAGRERYGSDVSSVKDGKLKRQMLRNENSLYYKNHAGWRRQEKLTKEFLLNAQKILGKNGIYAAYAHQKEIKELGEKYIKDIASARLSNMGYKVTENNVNTLAGKKWFRNSTWVSGRLAYLGLNDVDNYVGDAAFLGRKYMI